MLHHLGADYLVEAPEQVIEENGSGQCLDTGQEGAAPAASAGAPLLRPRKTGGPGESGS